MSIEKDETIKLLLELLRIVINKDTEITVGQAYEFVRIKNELKKLGLDINQHLIK